MAILISSCGTTKKATAVVDNQNTIRTDFSSYLNLIKDGEFDKAMDYLIPEFFEIVPRDQMIQVLEETFNSPELEFELKDPKILNVGAAKKVEDKFYSKLKYSNRMDIKFKREEGETKEDKEFTNNILKISFEETFGAENVTYNSETGFFEIYEEKSAISISNNGINDWKFLVLEKEQNAILEKLVPQEIIELSY